MKIAVSACLMGRNCKYNGGNNFCPAVVSFLKDKQIIEICPECLAGMPAPRPPVEIKSGKVINQAGEDMDMIYRNGVKKAIQQLSKENIELVILKSRSPTCGVRQIYDGTFTKTLVNHPGIFAEALIQAGYTVLEDEDFTSEQS